jgi:hypothetical protein
MIASDIFGGDTFMIKEIKMALLVITFMFTSLGYISQGYANVTHGSDGTLIVGGEHIGGHLKGEITLGGTHVGGVKILEGSGTQSFLEVNVMQFHPAESDTTIHGTPDIGIPGEEGGEGFRAMDEMPCEEPGMDEEYEDSSLNDLVELIDLQYDDYIDAKAELEDMIRESTLEPERYSAFELEQMQQIVEKEFETLNQYRARLQARLKDKRGL